MRKKQLLIIAATLITILILFLGISFLSGLKKSSPQQPVEFNPTPTPINTTTTTTHSFVGSSFPPNNMQGIGTNTNISYTFPSSVSAQEKNNISLQINPPTPGSLSWDKNTVIFTPDSPLTTNQQYTVTLSNGQSHNTWSFTTSSVAIDPNNASAEQQAGDVTFGKITQQNLTNYPWLNSLPLESSQFFVFFNIQQKAFEGTIYPNKNSSLSIEEQVKSIKSAVLQQLATMGIPTTIYPFVWTITPVSE